MKKILLPIFFPALFLSCNNQPEEQGYTLTGNVKNVPDSTMVVMSRNNIDIDSAMVLNEKFSFSGNVEEPYAVFLMFSGIREYTTVWLENSNIELFAEKGKFEERVISGSQVQMEDELLEAKIRPFRQARDSARAGNAKKTLTDKEQDSVYAFYDNLRKKEQQATRNFVKENPNSVVSAYILNFYKTTWGKKATEELYANITAERRESTDGKMIAHYLKINKDPEVGEQYEDFEMTNAKGEAIRLSDIKGKYTLVYFWAANCFPSRQENPNLVQNYETFKDHGFEILGISIDGDRNTFLGSIQEHNLTWNNLMSPAGSDNDAALIYGVNGTPDNFLIDEQGTIIARNIRGEALTTKLQELMPATRTANL